MLTAKDNATLTQVGPGTAMGNLMREFWIPACQSSELAEPDGAPLRLRLLGENLIAWRQPDGSIGVMQNACPHRGASMFFGRNEENGLRCVYHGWKFDTSGACIDMPNEPAESNFKHKIKAAAYPCAERNGMVWAYMGPRSTPPALPDLESTMLPADRYETVILNYLRECNYMQALEGDIDTVHSNFLHDGAVDFQTLTPGTGDYYRRKTQAPKFAVTETDYGTLYSAQVPAEADSSYWRLANFLFPFYTQIPSGILGAQILTRMWVPLDDENTMFWSVTCKRVENANDPAIYRSRMRREADALMASSQGHGLLPNTSDSLGRFRLGAVAGNDYLIDRGRQASRKSFTGMTGIGIQDCAVQESMGPIADRTQEFLLYGDMAIVKIRRLLLQTLKDFADGKLPPGMDPASYRVRSATYEAPKGAPFAQTMYPHVRLDSKSVS